MAVLFFACIIIAERGIEMNQTEKILEFDKINLDYSRLSRESG